MAALTVELESTTSEVERASASAETVAAAAAEAEQERRSSVQGLHDRLKSSEDTIEQLSVRCTLYLNICHSVTTLNPLISVLSSQQCMSKRSGFEGAVWSAGAIACRGRSTC